MSKTITNIKIQINSIFFEKKQEKQTNNSLNTNDSDRKIRQDSILVLG